MVKMNIHAEKIEIVKMVLETNNPMLLKSVKSLFAKKSTDFWQTLSPDQKEDIEKGISEI
jgi:hypothetical protein